MTAPAAVVAGPAAVAVAGAWFFPWLVAAIAYYHSVSLSRQKKKVVPTLNESHSTTKEHNTIGFYHLLMGSIGPGKENVCLTLVVIIQLS